MNRVLKNWLGLFALVATLIGCGVNPGHELPPDTTVLEPDFNPSPPRILPCPSGGTVGPVVVEATWPQTSTSEVITIAQWSNLGQFTVKNRGTMPVKLEQVKLTVSGSTLNKLQYHLSERWQTGWSPIGSNAYPDTGGILDFGTTLAEQDAQIPGGQEITINLRISNGQPSSGDVWQFSLPKGGIKYGTAPTCADTKHGLEAEGQPVLGRVVKY